MSTEAPGVSEAYGAARALLAEAEAEAVRIRADADRYHRQRSQEAELLVGKARRLLAVAEQRAASLVAAAPVAGAMADPAFADPATTGPPTDDPSVGGVIDLTARRPVVALAGSGAADAPVVATGLDGMLKAAIARAVDQSFHLGT